VFATVVDQRASLGKVEWDRKRSGKFVDRTQRQNRKAGTCCA